MIVHFFVICFVVFTLIDTARFSSVEFQFLFVVDGSEKLKLHTAKAGGISDSVSG